MSPAQKLTPRSISDADWLQWPSIKEVFAALRADGDTVRAVGGAVRNTLLSRPVNEVDLATTATPEKVLELADAAGLKIVPTGIDHGTVTVIADHRPFEVTTLRKDVETYGRHAKIAYTDDWAEDASRRDFTINALYADPDGTLFDPLGSLGDIAARRVRFIGDARARVREDYLRILRFFRFNAELGVEEYDEESLLACVREHAGLAGLSGERVQSELLRLLRAPGALAAIYKMFEYGLLVDVLGDAPHLDRLRSLIEIETALEREPDSVLRLAALAIWVPEDATRLFEKLRLSNADRSKLKAAAEHGDIAAETYDADILWGLYRRGREDYLSAALVAWADSGMPPGDAVWRGMIARIVDADIPEFPVTGGDIVSSGLAEGPAVGELLKALEVHWMASGFADGKDKLLQVAEELTNAGS